MVRVVRDGAVDALHCGHVAVVDTGGTILAAHGDPSTQIYPRSALKPFQAAAVLELTSRPPPSPELSIIAASHTGSPGHQAVVRRVLDRAGLTPSALRCPPALPADAAALRQRPEPTRLAHNCSGKHAGFLLATVGAGEDPSGYLRPDAAVQHAVRAWLRRTCAVEPAGPGVDGCGAPAWLLPLRALAHGYATLAGAGDELGHVAAAMRTHPELIGGHQVVDTELMRAEAAIVAKRGAEAALAIAVRPPVGPLGIAIKVTDGGARAVGPVAAAVLSALGLRGAAGLIRPVVLGGGVPHGAVEVTSELRRSLAALRSQH